LAHAGSLVELSSGDGASTNSSAPLYYHPHGAAVGSQNPRGNQRFSTSPSVAAPGLGGTRPAFRKPEGDRTTGPDRPSPPRTRHEPGGHRTPPGSFPGIGCRVLAAGRFVSARVGRSPRPDTRADPRASFTSPMRLSDPLLSGGGGPGWGVVGRRIGLGRDIKGPPTPYPDPPPPERREGNRIASPGLCIRPVATTDANIAAHPYYLVSAPADSSIPVVTT
jgi:hypothetical protein